MQRISVILPVYNEEKYIEVCLESVVKQSHKADEIIVVDDGSNDSSKFKVQSFGKLRIDPEQSRTGQSSKLKFKIKNIILLEQEHRGPAVARNLGAKKAKGNVLVFLDADMVYDKDFLKEITKPIIEGSEIATFTKEEYTANLDNVWAKFWDDVTFSNLGRRVTKELGERGITFRAILGSKFRKVGGYNSYGSSDDRSILVKLGETSKNVPTAFCYHYNPSSLSEVYSSARWIGRDTKNKYQWRLFLVFSPLFSVIRGFIGTLRSQSLYFFPFRVAFDLGFLLGLVDIHVRNIHYK